MSDVYVLGIDMMKFGRFPDTDGPAARRAGRADGARRCGPDDPGDAGALLRQPRPGQRAWSASASCSEIGQTGVPVVNSRTRAPPARPRSARRGSAIKAGVYDIVLAVGVEQMGKGLLGGGGGGERHSDRRPARLGHDAGGLRRGRHGAQPQVRHDVRAVREGVGEEPPPLDA